jgi:hypothetical protein
VKHHASDPSENYNTVDLEMRARAPTLERLFRITSAKFGTSCPTCVPNTRVGCISSLCRNERMGGYLKSCFSTTISALTMLGTWFMPPRISYPALCKMARRKVSHGIPLCASTQNNIPS